MGKHSWATSAACAAATVVAAAAGAARGQAVPIAPPAAGGPPNPGGAQSPGVSAAAGPNPSPIESGVGRFERRMEQLQQQNRVAANPDIPAGQRVFVDYGAYALFSYLSVDDANSDNRGLREYDLIGYAHVNFDGAHDFFVRARSTYRDFNPGDSFDGDGSREHSVVEQAYYRFDLQRYLGAYNHQTINNDSTFQGGRQTVVWGNGLTFNQDVDGVVVDGTLAGGADGVGPTTLEGVAGVTVPDTIDFDATRPGFNDRTTRGFYGLLLSTQIGRHRPYAFALLQRDYNPNERVTIAIPNSSPAVGRFDYNSVYYGLGSSGSLTDKLVYGVEATYENGSGLTTPFERANGALVPLPQTHEPIQAFALDGRLDYLFGDPHLTRLSGEVIAGSGDTDRTTTSGTIGGNKPHTHDNAFNGFGLLNTGLAFNPQVSNVLILRGGASTNPLVDFDYFRKLQVGTDVFLYQKFRARAPIDEGSGNGRYLGWEPDLFVNWQITSDLTFAVRYGIFFPGNKLANQKNRQFIFSGLTLAF